MSNAIATGTFPIDGQDGTRRITDRCLVYAHFKRAESRGFPISLLYSPFEMLFKIRLNSLRAQIRTSLRNDSTTEVDEAFNHVIALRSAIFAFFYIAVHECVVGAYVVLTVTPLMVIVRNFTKENKHRAAGAELILLELDAAGPIVYRATKR